MVDELERRGLDGPQVTDLESTQPVTQEDHDAVEQILHPGHSGGGVTGPPMTDHEVGGKYETEVIAALDALYTDTVSALVKTPAVDMNHANRVSAAAQEEVEKFFGASITMASRKPTGEWHPGSSAMGLADASKRPMSQGDILGWTDYFMDNGSYAPAQIAAGLHYDGTRLDPDHKAHDRVRALWLSKHDGKRKASEMARAWPAEASTGTVFLQLRDAGYQNKVGMWDLFMTLVHEFMHLVTHPNYGNAADLIGGGGRDILIEGMDEHMSQQVWPAVRDRAFGDLALRTLVEGPFLNDPRAEGGGLRGRRRDRQADQGPRLRLDGGRGRDRLPRGRGQRARGVLHGPRRGDRDRRRQRERDAARHRRDLDRGRRRHAGRLRRPARRRDPAAGARPHPRARASRPRAAR